MSWLTYFLIFLVVCIVWFIIVRIWINGVDLVISIFKKILRLDKKKDGAETWHTLEDLRGRNKDD